MVRITRLSIMKVTRTIRTLCIALLYRYRTHRLHKFSWSYSWSYFSIYFSCKLQNYKLKVS